ncbi:amidohydrolase [Roseococcus sp. SYP-B2431]|uniref:M20 aminoacylase family protein n=1 Tax=Roseococcus sp. SYP-B2431 TaxID=2496640 RepID=UPI0010403D5D|nr:M20 aminoacylase family protein [Roseococcus sp. SYP-B2431]TCI00394.1 amidohydrolase [Roseococcus sp. SYP-B2431]
MPIINRVAEFHSEMTEWRQDFHRHPELGFEEFRTSGIVADKLREFGCDEVVTGIAKTGVVGVIHGRNGKSGRAIGLRADMDALPIEEANGLPHASTIPGKMHACGHDGHTTMLLGAAKYLAETRNFDGTVYVIFQPAEENLAGGGVMVEEGLFDRFPVDRVFGLHNWPGAPAGTFVWREGPVMAAVANLEVTITGKGAHGALPFQGNDPIVIAAAIVQALQSVVARNLDASDAGVITIGHINGGHTYNVIPETVTMLGTARWFLPEVGDLLEEKFKALVTGIAASFGATATAEFKRAYPATVNEAESTQLALKAALAVGGEQRVMHMAKPTMGAEDFSFMLNARPGAYLMLGGGKTDQDPGVHHPLYDFNDDILPVGASYWVTLAEQLLPRG